VTEPIRYRPTRRQYPWWLLLLPVIQGGTYLVLDSPLPWPYYAVLWPVLVAESFWLMTFGVELTGDALVMRGLRKRVIPWRRIDWIGPVPYWGATMVGVRYGGRTRRLRAPYHQPFLAPDPGFEAKARTIYEAWVRGTT
jgi:hypothetical protein